MSQAAFKNISNTFDDRFIPNRKNSNISLARFKLTSTVEKEKCVDDIFSQKLEYYKEYHELLKRTLNYYDSPLLSIVNKTKQKNKKSNLKICLHWPVVPRNSPVLNKPEIILDLPNIAPELYWNIVDWSSTDYLATVFSYKVYLWHAQKLPSDEVTNTGIEAYGALKWNNTGTYLAVGNHQKLQVWILPKKKLLDETSCCSSCQISVLAWDKTDRRLVSGCSRGIVFVWNITKGLHSRNGVLAHDDHCVVSLVFCSSNRFLCSSGADGFVRVWRWPKLQPHVEIEYSSTVRAIAFHPWRPALLAVGGGVGDGSIAVWNVNTYTKIGYMKPKHDSFVDYISWSALSGELVSSHQVTIDNFHYCTKILVLENLDRVVDSITMHGRVLYLLWDYTGTKLATASCDESLCIWNFFGNSKNFNASNRNQTQKPQLSIFGKCIR